MDPIIQLKNVSVVYGLGKTNETVALSDINIEIFPGEYIIFFGPSGCGKSTLLYTIAGLEKATDGEILVNNKRISHASKKELIDFHRSTIGMVFQAYYLIPHLNAVDNLILPTMFLDETMEAGRKIAEKLMDRFGITQFQNRKPAQLSGGQQQRTAIARALMNDPVVILADEPVGNLDSKNAQVVLDIFKEINEVEKKTLIYVTHNPLDLKYADRVFHMRDGKVERITVNKKSRSTTDQHSDVDLLTQQFPFLSESQIRTKLILNKLLVPYDLKTMQKVEEIINEYVTENKNKDFLIEQLDKKDGAGLYVQKAHSLAEQIAKLVDEMKFAQENKEENVLEEVVHLRKYLLDDYAGSLSLDQVKKFESILSDYIHDKINETQLVDLLDRPLKQNGVGLNKRTVSKIMREIELILSK